MHFKYMHPPDPTKYVIIIKNIRDLNKTSAVTHSFVFKCNKEDYLSTHSFSKYSRGNVFLASLVKCGDKR
jgi:hypothetical protein